MATKPTKTAGQDFIPVVLLGPDGQPTSGHFGIPCIQIRYTFTQPVQTAAGFQCTNLRTVWALLDTGADWNLIHEDLLPQSYPILDQLTNTGIGGSVPTTNHGVWMYLDPIEIIHTTGIMTMKRTGMPPYDLILGRKFLQCTRFTYDLVSGCTLEWITNLQAL